MVHIKHGWFLNTNPINLSLTPKQSYTAKDYNVMLFPELLTVQQIRDNGTVGAYSRPDLNDTFTKARVVAAGMRIFKTSQSDTESGTLDFVYSPEGAAFDDNHQISMGLGKARRDRERVFLASAGDDCRGKAGFVAQANYRPYSYENLEMEDVGTHHMTQARQLVLGGEQSIVWFATNGNRIVSLEDVMEHADPDEEIKGLVLESL